VGHPGRLDGAEVGDVIDAGGPEILMRKGGANPQGISDIQDLPGHGPVTPGVDGTRSRVAGPTPSAAVLEPVIVGCSSCDEQWAIPEVAIGLTCGACEVGVLMEVVR
jgi:hypothetical protein